MLFKLGFQALATSLSVDAFLCKHEQQHKPQGSISTTTTNFPRFQNDVYSCNYNNQLINRILQRRTISLSLTMGQAFRRASGRIRAASETDTSSFSKPKIAVDHRPPPSKVATDKAAETSKAVKGVEDSLNDGQSLFLFISGFNLWFVRVMPDIRKCNWVLQRLRP